MNFTKSELIKYTLNNSVSQDKEVIRQLIEEIRTIEDINSAEYIQLNENIRYLASKIEYSLFWNYENKEDYLKKEFNFTLLEEVEE